MNPGVRSTQPLITIYGPYFKVRFHISALPAARQRQLAPVEEGLGEDGRAVLGQPDGEVEGADLEAAARPQVVLLGHAGPLQLQVALLPEHVGHEEAQLKDDSDN